MIDVLKFVFLGIVAALLSVVLKQQRPELALLISVSAGVILFTLALGKLQEVLSYAGNLAEQYGLNTGYIGIAVKITGIACLCDMGAQLCRDAGESAIASKVELGGKLVIVILALPVMGELLSTVARMLT